MPPRHYAEKSRLDVCTATYSSISMLGAATHDAFPIFLHTKFIIIIFNFIICTIVGLRTIEHWRQQYSW